jgi:hypothetical protein
MEPNPSPDRATILLPSVLRATLQFRPIGIREVPDGSTRHTAATAETMGYARAFHRAFDWQPRCLSQ